MTNSKGAYARLAIRTRRAVARLTMACGVLLVGLSSASADVTIPDTPAGRAMSAWLSAFNSGDRTQLDGCARETF
jgi:hypothetical protein